MDAGAGSSAGGTDRHQVRWLRSLCRYSHNLSIARTALGSVSRNQDRFWRPHWAHLAGFHLRRRYSSFAQRTPETDGLTG